MEHRIFSEVFNDPTIKTIKIHCMECHQNYSFTGTFRDLQKQQLRCCPICGEITGWNMKQAAPFYWPGSRHAGWDLWEPITNPYHPGYLKKENAIFDFMR